MVKAKASTRGKSGFAAASISAVIKARRGNEGLERDYLPHISDTYTTYISNGPISWFLSFADMSLQRRECLDGSGGMFLWARLRVGYHPQLYILSPEEISDKVVQTLIGEKIMVAPSSYSKRLEGLYGLKAKNVEEA
ncbi:hypothetical protein CNBG_1546 [Cryptococcus deuterogattii R265]|uniref:uncharacterized protein n=1 Tax=Cryptococcus deuterogattii (strain R265) TaxID=294750 RepID=UPI0019352679|nr:hypothetical protein CNBG_1546 [Cryptococcus deuterogattii R265]